MAAEECVEATPIDPPAALTGAGAWVAEKAARVAEVAARYQPFEIADESGYRDAKRQRAALRAEISDIDAERKAMTRSVDQAVKAFRDAARDVTAPLAELDAEYRARIQEWDAGALRRRADALEAAYAEYAPQLVPLVPFERLSARYSEAGRWYLRSTGEAKAVESMEAAVDDVARNERQIGMFDLSPEDAESLRAEYFSTLDLQSAARHAMEQREQRERVRALDAERAEAAGDAPRGESPATARGREVAEACIAGNVSGPAPEERQTYVFEFQLSAGELSQLMAFVRSRGIHGKRRRLQQ